MDMKGKVSYGLALLSGVLLLLSFPPFKFGFFLAWIALVPLLIAVFHEAKVKRLNRLISITALGALPIFLWIAWWTRELLSLAHLGWLGFVLGLALAVAIAIGFYGGYIKDYWKPKYLPSKSLSYLPSGLWLVALPLMWTSIEFLAMNIPGVMRIGGVFGFFSIAKTQWLNPPIMQLASFTGMYGITFLILLVNCAIAYAIIHYKEIKQVFKPTIYVLCLFALIFSYGWINIPSVAEGNVTVAVIQAPPIEGEDTSALYLNLSEKALKYNPQIIVWSGLIFEGLVVKPYENFTRDHNVYLMGFTESYGILSPDGSLSVDNFGYHIFTIPRDIMAGDIKSLFFPEVYSLDTELGKIGVADCAESGSTLPTLDRVRRGAQLLVVPTGSPNAYVFSWALGTNAIYRAVEHRMFAIEVIGDWDASMIIDPYGRIISDAAPEPEIVVGKISFTDERTFYTKYGDVFGWSVALIGIGLMAYNFYLKRKSPFEYCKNCRARIKKGAKVCERCKKKAREKRPLWKRVLLHEYYEYVKGE